MLGSVWDHFGPVCLVLILGSQALTRRAQRQRWRNEARNLRACLSLNLQALRTLYLHNLSALTANESPLLSGRQQISLLRTQLGRLTSLDKSDVEAVTLACIAMEKAEATLVVAGKGHGGARLPNPRRDERRTILLSTLRETCALLEEAEQLLNSDRNCAAAPVATTAAPGDRAEDCVDPAVQLKVVPGRGGPRSGAFARHRLIR
jgi:hypothetical protein